MASLPERLNLVVYVLDAARADHFGCYGYERDTTPNIDALAKRSTRYVWTLSEAPYTFASTAALLTGMPTAETRLLKPQAISGRFSLLAEVAASRGYATYGYSENPFVTRKLGFAQGFEYFAEAYPLEALLRDDSRPPVFDSRANLLEILGRATADPSRPFLLYLHILRPHDPYAPPEGFAGRFGSRPDRQDEGSVDMLRAIDQGETKMDADRIENIIALYDENLAYADALFGELMAALKARKLLDDTVIVVTSDHGEAFGEHGRMLHNSQVYDAMIRVPLVIHVPGREAEVVKQPVQLADLGRGLQRLLRGDPDAAKSLSALRQPDAEETTFSFTEPKYARSAIRTSSRKLIIDTESMQPLAYHDLSRDPAEREAIALDAAGLELLRQLHPRVMGLLGQPREDVPPELDEADLERLRALGYLESRSEKPSGASK